MDTPPATSPRWYAVAGALTGAAGVATSLGTAWALQANTNPVVAVASEVRDHTPGSLAHHLISTVGHADKPLLVTGTVVVLIGLCAVAGRLNLRHPLWSDLVFFVLAVVGLLAVLNQSHADGAALVSLVVGFVTWVLVLRILIAQLHGDRAGVVIGEPVSRRAFLGASGGVIAVGALAMYGGHLAGRGRAAVNSARARLRLPIKASKPSVGVDLGVPGIAPWRTQNSDFYQISTALISPNLLPSQWRLRIHGMVDHELELSYQDLISREFTQAWVTLCCVSNPVGGNLIGNAYWSGVLVRDLLSEAGVQAGADAVKQTSYDGWTCGTPLSTLTDDRNALLAVGMNGQPLPVDHGFPVRMVVPGLYGYVSATKWVVDLEVTRFDKFRAYWTNEGWSPLGPVKTESRIDVPGAGQTVPAGTVNVGGVAWAQHTGIAAVHVQLDGGPWLPTTLGRVPDNDTWVQWTTQVQAPSGAHELRVRATDRSGYTQTAVRTDVIPNGASGWHTIGFNTH